MEDEGQAADDQIADLVPGEELEDVLEVLNGIHGSLRRFFQPRSGSLGECHILADGDERREPLLGRTALPVVKVSLLGILEGLGAVDLDALPAAAAALLNAHNHQYFTSIRHLGPRCRPMTALASSALPAISCVHP